MLDYKIRRINVLRIDEDALALLKSKTNPQTGIADVTMSKLTELLRCAPATTNRVVRRLEGAKLIIRHRKQGRCGAEIEVIRSDDGSHTSRRN